RRRRRPADPPDRLRTLPVHGRRQPRGPRRRDGGQPAAARRLGNSRTLPARSEVTRFLLLSTIGVPTGLLHAAEPVNNVETLHPLENPPVWCVFYFHRMRSFRLAQSFHVILPRAKPNCRTFCRTASTRPRDPAARLRR